MAAPKGRSKSRGVGASYSGPYGRTPLSHVTYLQDRHLHPERLPSARHEKVVTVKLLDLSRESVENVQQVSGTVRRLILANLRLRSIPESLIDSLHILERLDLGHNQLGDAGFPDAMKNLTNLVELRVNDNNLTKVPACLKRMQKLQRIDLSNNKLETLKGLEKQKRLKILVVDDNRLSSIFGDISHMKRLEILRCSRNNIRDIPREINQLKFLSDIDVSGNRLTSLPGDIFKLADLEVLKASNNEISRIPSFNVPVQNRHWVGEIDLSENSLVNFPGHLLLMSNKLDLSSNNIRVLNYNVIKKLDWDTDQELLLQGNPLIYPPEHVCDCGLRPIIQYMQEAQAEIKVYQGVKLLVLGSHKSGKTSLVHSLVDGQPRLVDESYDSSASVEAYDMTFEYGVANGKADKTLHLSIWDFCGHPFYQYPHYLFYEQPSIAILTFNMSTYGEDDFQAVIGAWVDWMIAKTNKLVVLIVGTQADRLPAEKVKAVSRQVLAQLSDYLARKRSMIEERIKAIESRPHISPTLSEQLKAYMRLLQSKCTIQAEIIVTSVARFTGFDQLRASIEKLTSDKKQFPNVMRVIPTFWVEVESYVEDKGNSLGVPVMTWEDYTADITIRFGMKHLLRSITTYLHETGKVLWFSSSPTLKQYVFLRPSWLFDLFRQVFRHDFADKISYTQDDSFKSAGLTLTKFERGRTEMLGQGVLERDFLKGLCASFIPPSENTDTVFIAKLLVETFQMAYPVARKTKDNIYNLNADKDSEGNTKMVRVLLPWLRKSSEPEYLKELWKELTDRRALVAVFVFPRYMPPGLFEVFSVLAHKETHKLKFQAHWGGGLHAKHEEKPVHVLLTYGPWQEGGFCLRLELRDQSHDREDQVPAATMWGMLHPLILDFEDLLQEYAGVWAERRVECPMCRCPSFLGEWLTPKELQSLPTKQCEKCREDIDTAFLIQPREKKRDDVLLTLAKRRGARRRGAAGGSQRGKPVSPPADVDSDLYLTSPSPRRGAALADVEDFRRLFGIKSETPMGGDGDGGGDGDDESNSKASSRRASAVPGWDDSLRTSARRRTSAFPVAEESMTGMSIDEFAAEIDASADPQRTSGFPALSLSNMGLQYGGATTGTGFNDLDDDDVDDLPSLPLPRRRRQNDLTSDDV